MKTYTTTVKFYRRFKIEAKDTSEANEKLANLVNETEFSGNVEHDGYDLFDDEPSDFPAAQ
ncbi:MAG: hypothetical protein EBS05_10210 [Proteobacteria bacterium]|nr:hypothetical protein [Pseudomonadota bacterium]